MLVYDNLPWFRVQGVGAPLPIFGWGNTTARCERPSIAAFAALPGTFCSISSPTIWSVSRNSSRLDGTASRTDRDELPNAAPGQQHRPSQATTCPARNAQQPSSEVFRQTARLSRSGQYRRPLVRGDSNAPHHTRQHQGRRPGTCPCHQQRARSAPPRRRLLRLAELYAQSRKASELS
jgi:hypothetical protein